MLWKELSFLPKLTEGKFYYKKNFCLRLRRDLRITSICHRPSAERSLLTLGIIIKRGSFSYGTRSNS